MQFDLGLLGIPADMIRENDALQFAQSVVDRDRLVFVDIQRCSADEAVFHGFIKRGRIDHTSPRRVDKSRFPLHPLELLLPEHMMRPVIERGVDGHDIGFP